MKPASLSKFAWMFVVTGLTVGCTEGPGDELEPEDRDPAGAEDGKLEAWNSANNPAYVDSTFLMYAHQLPLSGGGHAPIPGDYWASASDSINIKWDGASSLAPSEKYAKAFNKPGVPDQVSRSNGVKASTSRKACTTSNDCDSLMDGSECAASYDNAEHRCIPGWWGICHGWAPYALSEPAARMPVTRTAGDGTSITFYPGDLEALMSMLYTNVPEKFISSRCNKDMPPTDSNGRILAGECRDMNPGTWHVVVTNLMGLRHQGFVLDQTYDDQVWNQPGRDFRITNADGDKLHEVSVSEALDILGVAGTLSPVITDVTVAKDEEKSGSTAATTPGVYKFKLSGTGDADLYVKKGSAPTLSSYDCRPYTGTSLEDCSVTLAAGETAYWMVAGYSTSSKVSLGVSIPSDGPASYIYNPAAKKFYYVEMDFRFVVEASPSRSSHIDQVDSYTQTKHYSYILEADEFNKILGGEWTGGSLDDHPDFAWWPTGTPSSTTAGISYADVRALNEESAGMGGGGGGGSVTVMNNVSISTSGDWSSKYAAVTVESGVTNLKVTMTGSGDADLYVRRGQNPTVYTYGCKSTTAGTSNETCSVPVGSAGTYYVRARTRTPGTTVTVVAEKQ